MAVTAKQVGQYIANWFIYIKKPTTNLALQKLLYFSWIDYYKAKRKMLFEDSFVAWPLGPVVLSSYYDFCAFAGEPIIRKLSVKVDEIDLAVLEKSLETRKDWTVHQLVEASHRPNGAWIEVYKGGEGRDEVIPASLIIARECAL